MSDRDVTRALYDAAVATRPHVEEAEGWYRSLLLTPKAEDAAEVLERLDAALADAGELLAEVPS